MRQKKIDWRWGLPLLFALIAAGMVALLSDYTRIKSEKIYLTPLLNDDLGWEIYEKGENVYLSRILSKEYEQEGITYLQLDSTRPSAVFLNDGLLYTTCPEAGNEIGSVSFPENYQPVPGAGESVRITLPAGYGGKQLTIVTSISEAAGTPSVWLSSKSISDAETFGTASGIAMPAAVYAVCALFLLGLFFYGGFTGKWDVSLLLLMLAAFSQCFYHLQKYEHYSAAPSVLAISASGFFGPLFIYLPMFYLLFQMKKYRKIYGLVLFGISVLNLAFVAFSVYFMSLPSWDQILFYPALGVLLVFSVLEACNKNPVFRIFVTGFGLAAGMMACIGVGSLFGTGYYWSFIKTLLPQRDWNIYPGAVLWIGSLLFLLCVAISIMQLISSTVQMQTEFQVLEMKNTLALEQLRILRESSEELAAARHNMLHHLTAIDQLNDSGQQRRISEYISRLAAETKAVIPLRFTDNTLVNSLLALTAERSAKNEITFEAHVSLPTHLSVADNDLCNFLMNMLDNALEALSELPRERRFLSFTMHVRGKYLFMETENTFSGLAECDKTTGLFPTGKQGDHGYGLKTMQKIARKYQGDLVAEAQKDRFLVRTALLMPEEKGMTL